MRVLLVEDDDRVAAALRTALGRQQIEVVRLAGGRDVVSHLAGIDVVLLDLGLPDVDGIEVCRRIRAAGDTPVIVVSARGEVDDRILGLHSGADDYLVKPYDAGELVARIHAIVRRSKGHSQSVIRTGKLAVNLDAKTVEVDGARVHLTGKEYAMLELLSLRKGTTLTKEMFLNHLYGGMDEPELKIIDVFICKLRKKLALACSGDNYIETVWGRGYVLRDPEEAGDALSTQVA